MSGSQSKKTANPFRGKSKGTLSRSKLAGSEIRAFDLFCRSSWFAPSRVPIFSETEAFQQSKSKGFRADSRPIFRGCREPSHAIGSPTWIQSLRRPATSRCCRMIPVRPAVGGRQCLGAALYVNSPACREPPWLLTRCVESGFARLFPLEWSAAWYEDRRPHYRLALVAERLAGIVAEFATKASGEGDGKSSHSLRSEVQKAYLHHDLRSGRRGGRRHRGSLYR